MINEKKEERKISQPIHVIIFDENILKKYTDFEYSINRSNCISIIWPLWKYDVLFVSQFNKITD